VSHLSEQWYLGRSGKRYGPYSWEQLMRFSRENQIDRNDLLWREGMNSWLKANQVEGLFSQTGTGEEPPAPAAAQPAFKKSRAGIIAAVIGLAAVLVLGAVAMQLLNLRPEMGDEKITLLGTFIVDERGGSFSRPGIEITVAAGRPGTSSELSVTEIIRQEPLLEDVAFQSPLYQLEGCLEQVEGEIRITLDLPRKALQHPYNNLDDLSTSLFIELEEELFSPSRGPVTARYPLETEIDLDAGTISAVLRVDQGDLATAGPALFASRELPVQLVGQQEPHGFNEQIRFQVTRYNIYWYEATSPQGLFTAFFHPKALVQQQSIQEVLEELERQKMKLEQLGFSFDRRTNYPIPVWIHYIGEDGYYQGSKRGDNYGSLHLSYQYYFDNPLKLYRRTGAWDQMVATAGHELFHMVQSFYDSRPAIWKNHAWVEHPYHWVNEATATWYEALALDNPNYLSPNAQDNINFIQTPLYFPGSTTSQAGHSAVTSHGYGASLFFRYLVDRLDDRLPVRLYHKISEQDYRFVGYMLNQVLAEHYGTFTDEQWISFLAAYLITPDQIVPGLNTRPLWEKQMVLRARENDGEVRIFFEPNVAMSAFEIDRVEGRPGEGLDATTTLEFRMANLTGEAFLLSLSDDPYTREILQHPGRIRIKVSTSGDTGVIVYAANNFPDANSVMPIAPEPWRFLASNAGVAEMHRGASETAVEPFGFAGDSWSQVLFVPMNYDCISNRLQEETVTVRVTYEPEMEEITGDWEGALVLEAVHYSGQITLGGTVYDADNDRADIGKEVPFGFPIQQDEQGGYYTDSPYIREFNISGREFFLSSGSDFEGGYVKYLGTFDEEWKTISGTFEVGHTDYGMLASGRWRVRKQE